jgi:hypothetical protein
MTASPTAALTCLGILEHRLSASGTGMIDSALSIRGVGLLLAARPDGPPFAVCKGLEY